MNQLNLQQELTTVLEQIQTIQAALETTATTPSSFADYDFDLINRQARQMSYHDHPLTRALDSDKQLYLTVLASVLGVMNHDLTTNLIFFTRLHTAVQAEGSVINLLKTATELDEYLFDEFFPKLIGSPLRYNFIVDALILSSCHGQPAVQTLHYLAELANLLGFAEADLAQMTTLSKIILLQNEQLFHQAFESLNPILDYFLYYTQTFASGVLVANERYFKFTAANLRPFPSEYQKTITSLIVEIDHASFDLTQFTKPLDFKGNQLVYLRDSKFSTKKTAYLPKYFNFSQIQSLQWQNLTIESTQITAATQPLVLFHCQQIEFFQIDTLTMEHNLFTVDLGELKAQNALLKVPELIPFTGVVITAEAVTRAKIINLTIHDTHTRLQYATQNVLFGGTDFKTRTLTDGPAHSLIAGLDHAETNQLRQKESCQLFSN